jgi:membrane protease YdiL (CAAX protease family)
VENQHENFEQEGEPQLPHFGIFDRINNYILLIYALACFMMYYSISGLLYLKGQFLLSLSLPGIVAFVLPLFFLTKRFSLAFMEEYRLVSPNPVTAAIALLIAGSAILPVDALSGVLERRWPPEAEYINFLLAIKPKGTLHFLGVAAGTVVIASVGEELIFRGFIQRIFERNMRGTIAVVLASLVFGLAHFSMAILPGVTVLGIVFGYLFFRTGNLLYPVFAHALYNLVSLLRLHLTPEIEIQSAAVGPLSIKWTLLSLLALVLGIVLLERHLAKPSGDQ